MVKKVILMTVFLLSFSTVFAGVTGKIAGMIVDSESGQPLPGVNVIIEGHNDGCGDGH